MMKHTFRLLNKILAFLLALLGVQSCDPGEEEYGCPSADYIFHGKVTDEEGNALSGVKIYAMKNYEEYKSEIGRLSEYSERHRETAYKNLFDSLSVTKDDGSYSLLLQYECGWFNLDGLYFANKDGMYADTLLRNIKLEPLKGGKGWRNGVSENTLDITLKKN